MFDPQRLLVKMNYRPDQMSVDQLVEAISRLASETRSKGSPGYYVQRMEAIAILAASAASQLRDQ